MTQEPVTPLGAREQFLWGGAGGALPTVVLLIKQQFDAVLIPGKPWWFPVTSIAAAMLLGALLSRAFKSHDFLPALYHGATAPITVAFVLYHPP
jgi:hypothetical protein